MLSDALSELSAPGSLHLNSHGVKPHPHPGGHESGNKRAASPNTHWSGKTNWTDSCRYTRGETE